MIEHGLLGDTILICNKDEARKVWQDRPRDRPRIWLEDEFIKAAPLDTPEVVKIIEAKKAKPGYTYKAAPSGKR